MRGNVAALLLLGLPLSVESATVRGRLVDGAGRAVAGARVVAYEEVTPYVAWGRLADGKVVEEPAATAAAGEQGRFALTLPDAGKSYRLEAVAPGYARAFVGLAGGAESDLSLPAVMLEPERRRAGVVNGPDGTPVAGAWVRFSWVLVGGATLRVEARTGAEGRFDLAGAGALPGVLSVDAPGYAAWRRAGVTAESGTKVDLSPGRVLEGRVVDPDGRPAAGALVHGPDGTWGETVRTGADGRFRLSSLPAEASIVAELPGYVAAGWSGTLPMAEDAEGPRLVLGKGATLEVRAVDAATRKPVVGAAVSLDGEKVAGGRTDRAGVCRREGLVPGGMSARVVAAGYAPATTGAVELRMGKARVVTVALARAEVLRGVVVGEGGEPIADATVAFRGASVATKSDGSFEISRSPSAERPPWVSDDERLLVTAEGYVPRRATAVPGTSLRIELLRGATVKGKVVDAAGAPVPGSRVWALSEGSDSGGDGQTIRTASDASGSFELKGVRKGSSHVVVQSPGMAPAGQSVLVADAETKDLGTIVLRRGASLQGKVVDERGRPVSGASIRGGVFEDGTFTDDEGRFRLAGLQEDQDAWFWVDAHGFLRKELHATPGPELLVELSRGHRVRGWVRQAGNGEPVATFSVASNPVRDPEERHFLVVRTAEVHSLDGRFEVGELPSGPVELTVRAFGYLDATRTLEIPADRQSLDGVEILLERGHTLSGIVRDGNGGPLHGVRVSSLTGTEPDDLDFEMLLGMGNLGPEEQGTSVTTDADGRFLLAGVSPGPNTLAATLGGYETFETVLQVDRDMADVAVTLRLGTPLRGVVLDSGGNPVTGAEVTVSGSPEDLANRDFPSNGLASTSVTDASGAFEVRGVRAGTQYVGARRDSETTPPVQIVVEAGAPASVTLRFARAIRIEGRVHGVAPEALPSLRVDAYGEGEGTAQTDGAGGFVVEGLRPGRANVSASVGAAHVSRDVVLSEAEPLVYLDLVFSGASRLHGVVSRGGKPVAGAFLSLDMESGVQEVGGGAMSGPDGRYEVAGIPDGAYQVQVSGSVVHHQRDVVVSGDTTLDIELPSAVLRGRVTSAATGAPIAGAEMELDGSSFRVPKSGSDGTFLLENLADGAHTLTVSAPGFGAVTTVVTVPADGDVAIALEREAPLRLEIVDAVSGAAPPSAKVAIIDAPDARCGWATAYPRPVPLDRGRFLVSGLAPGKHDLLVEVEGRPLVELLGVTAPGLAKVHVAPGGLVEVRGAPDCGALMLVGADEKPVWLREDSWVTQGVRASVPDVTLGPVPPGDYRVLVSGCGVPGDLRVAVRAGERSVVSLR